MKLWDRSKGLGIATNLIISLFALLLIFLGLYAYLMLRGGRLRLHEELRTDTRSLAMALGFSLQKSLRQRELREAQELLDLVGGYARILRATLWGPDLKPLLTSDPAIYGPIRFDSRFFRMFQSPKPVGFFSGEKGQETFHYALPLRAEDGKTIGVLEVVHEATYVTEEMTGLRDKAIVIFGATGAGMALLIWLLVFRNVTIPIRRLVEGATGIGKGDLHQRVRASGSRELSLLAREFNRMAENLEAAKVRLEEEIERRLKLERLAALGEVTAGLAHEIGTPLNVIGGRAEDLLEGLAPGHPFRRPLEIMAGQIERITKFIRQLLDYARPKRPSLKPVQLPELLAGMEELMRPEMVQRKVDCRIDCPGDLPTFKTDPDQLQQVLLNLWVNAIQAMPEGGSLEIRAAFLDGGGGGPGKGDSPWVCISFQDTGVGIPSQDLPRVFDPFFTSKAPGEGFGLGLAIAKGIVLAHGGRIEAHSDGAGGSLFQVFLPVEELVRGDA